MSTSYAYTTNIGADVTSGAWYGWASPVGLGLFFVLIAVAFDLVRFAFK